MTHSINIYRNLFAYFISTSKQITKELYNHFLESTGKLTCILNAVQAAMTNIKEANCL